MNQRLDEASTRRRATAAEAGAAMVRAPGGVSDFRPVAAWSAVVVLLLLYGLAFIDRQVISLLVGPIRKDLGIDDFQISLLQGFSFALLYSVCGLPLGFAVDRWPRRRVVFFGVIVWALAASACGLARTFPQLLAARLLVGMGEAALAPAAYSMLSDLFPARKLTFALSIYSIGALLGAALSMAVGAMVVRWAEAGVDLPLVGHLHAWQTAFLITGLPGVALSFLIFLIPEPPRTTRSGLGEGRWIDLGRFIAGRVGFFTCHIIGFASIMTLAYAYLAWGPTFLMRRYHWPVTTVGLTLAAFGFTTGAIAFLFSGRTVDAMVRRGIADAHFRFYIAATTVLMVSGATAFHASTPIVYFASMALGAVALNMAAIAASAIQLVTPANLRGRMSAVYLMVCGLAAMTLGPSSVAFFTDKVFHSDARIGDSLTLTFLVFAPIALTAFIFGLAPMRRAVAAAGAIRD